MSKMYHAVAALGVLTGCGFIATEMQAATPVADPLLHLAGRWVGNAVMTPSSGPQSSFKCVVTYLPRKDAPGLQQNLRCDDGANFKLHAATQLQVEGNKVIGRWQDKINDIDGTVDGNVTPTGFEIRLDGRFFQATMAVAGEGCDQSVRVLPQKSEVFRELAATLKKC
ncbi:MAG: hypothetical protein WBP38_05510 [Hyphomicrobium sp.]|jgi:hypothetical protein|nr:hypothetical protein [Hyphomicrobium sp.]